MMTSQLNLLRELNELGKDVISKFCDWHEASNSSQLYVKEKGGDETFFAKINTFEVKLYKLIENPSIIFSLKHDWYGDQIFFEDKRFDARSIWGTIEPNFLIFEKSVPIPELLLSFEEGKKEACSKFELFYQTQNFIIVSDKKRTKLMKFTTGYDYECVEFPSDVDATKIIEAINELRAFGGNYKTETLSLGDYRISIRIENGKTGLMPKHDKKVNIRWNEDKKRAFRLIQEKKEPLPF